VDFLLEDVGPIDLCSLVVALRDGHRASVRRARGAGMGRTL